ncbi:hypothetical protein OG292_25270 [Streptomyces sp. NBC_01511]|uniref:hypothetical protein n=1 Tax=Streptomyces sp. NBC_01511 TaxID=2903889 RepID=UPI00386B8AB9
MLAGEHGAVHHTDADSSQRIAVDLVITLYRRKTAGEDPPGSEWVAASRAAEAAGRAAAADHRLGPAAHAAATAYAAAAAQAPEAAPLAAQAASARAAAIDAVDDTTFEDYQAAYAEADALAQAAEYSREAMMDATEAAFHVTFAPVKDAAERARAASLRVGRSVSGTPQPGNRPTRRAKWPRPRWGSTPHGESIACCTTCPKGP